MPVAPVTSARPSQTMVLCAGFGQRLRPLTDELPKPLLPVGDRSVLAHIGSRLRALGRLDAVANTHWKHEKFNSIIEDLGITLNLIHEPEIRGVAGAVGGARAWLRAPVLVWSGDILIDQPPIDELVARAERSGGLCLAVAPTQGAGTVGLDAAGRMVRVRGRVHGEEVQGADYVSLFAAGERALAEFPEQGCLFDDYCLPRMRRGESIETCWVPGRWWDIGTPERYLQTNLDWLGGLDSSFVAPSAQVDAGVAFVSSVVGRGARVLGPGRIERCVIWPESVAHAPLSGCVVTPNSVLRVSPPAAP